ncbi:hypothetical protein LOAG_16386 [Loa loa]|uniref:Uncharacterized protein n=1 Tax=Loa loa TaxID=7209 RepID=A0A1S0ULX3_LOALO|nr:hypothetical protein LOAG_16386 [Loa loa]EJD76710.1 hypothetical protein LOAG_16386 [Loa loa]
MKSRTNSLRGSPETTASSSAEYSESNDNSDRHSTTPSVEMQLGDRKSFRKKEKEMKRRESEHSDDSNLPVKFRRKNDGYFKRLVYFLS